MADRGERKRAPRITAEQISMLVDYMCAHPLFATGKLLGPSGKASAQAQWIELQTQLNRAQGPVKTPDEWKKCWSDLRCTVRQKAAGNKKIRRGTGNTGEPVPLSDEEKKVLAVIGTESSFGLPLHEATSGANEEDLNDGTAVVYGVEDIHYELMDPLNSLDVSMTYDHDYIDTGAEIEMLDAPTAPQPTEQLDIENFVENDVASPRVVSRITKGRAKVKRTKKTPKLSAQLNSSTKLLKEETEKQVDVLKEINSSLGAGRVQLRTHRSQRENRPWYSLMRSD